MEAHSQSLIVVISRDNEEVISTDKAYSFANRRCFAHQTFKLPIFFL